MKIQKQVLRNKKFSTDDIEKETNIVKLLQWEMNQILTVTTAQLVYAKTKTLETEQYLIAQKGLLSYLETKIRIVELQQEAEFTENWE